MNKTITITILIAVALIGLFVWGNSTSKNGVMNKDLSKIKQEDIVSAEGIHWHPHLSIFIKGQEQIIPANVGIGSEYAKQPRYDRMMGMTDVHTHDSFGTLHWEVMQGPVIKDDIRLGNFFSIWGKQLTSQCVLDYCNGPNGMVKFIVNGKENSEFEKYLVKDGDKIEIRYE